MREGVGLLYFNCNGFAMAAVFVCTVGVDWKVYMGGCPVHLSTEDAFEWIALHGASLSWKWQSELIRALLEEGGCSVPTEPYRD